MISLMVMISIYQVLISFTKIMSPYCILIDDFKSCAKQNFMSKFIINLSQFSSFSPQSTSDSSPNKFAIK